MNWTLLAQLLAASEWIIRLTILPVIVLRKEKPATCLAWLAIIFFEPWVGLGLYLLIGENRLGRRRLALRGRRRRILQESDGVPSDPPDATPAAEGDEFSLLAHLAEHGGGMPVVAGNAISLMNETDVVIQRLIADIDSARHHVHLLFYIFQDDEVGRRVAQALGRAADRGVKCRVLADAVGSRRLFHRLAPLLRKRGVRVFPMLPANLWRLPFSRLDLRNHRKLAVIDGATAFAGSQNIVEASSASCRRFFSRTGFSRRASCSKIRPCFPRSRPKDPSPCR
jgi:cardiolipin synthase